jgi:hypothetical protein
MALSPPGLNNMYAPIDVRYSINMVNQVETELAHSIYDFNHSLPELPLGRALLSKHQQRGSIFNKAPKCAVNLECVISWRRRVI